MMVNKMLAIFCLLPLLCLTVTGQEVPFFELVQPHEQNPPAIVASVGKHQLELVSSSVLAAESWLKSHVLAHYPSTKITTIVVGNGIMCNKLYEPRWSLVLPSVKNLYHCLIRWDLLKEIKVSAFFTSDCFEASLAQETLKPLLGFLQESSLPYTFYPSHQTLIRDSRAMMKQQLSNSLDFASFASTHKEFLERLGFSTIRDIRMINEAKPIMKRKLSSLKSPSHPSFGFAPVPGSSFSFAPESLPSEVPASPPNAPLYSPLPFCLPPPAETPAPSAGEREKIGLWCVAKPTVPEEKLQEAIDFVCGESGTDCEEIRPNGSCFNPDNLVAHASYAFNSYWQKTKQSGGSCNFDGTAILINSDPSYRHCHFELS